MNKRVILIIPEIENINYIEDIRRLYDPLFGKVPPHITLVFPFESEMPPNEILNHVQIAASQYQRFPIQMKGFAGYNDEYLFLNVKQGKDKIAELHQRLYTGILNCYRDSKYTYSPHMTVGRLRDKASFEKALAKIQKVDLVFETAATELIIGMINDNDDMLIEGKIRLD